MLPFAHNPQAVAIKKYLFEILRERYARSSGYIDRLALGTMTREDYESLGALVADIYESGFMRAVDQYKSQMARLGMKVEVVPEGKPSAGDAIFKN